MSRGLGDVYKRQDLFVADTYNHKIRKVHLPTMECTTLIDRGELNEPAGICAVGERLLVADTNNHRVVWVDPGTGKVEELAVSA